MKCGNLSIYFEEFNKKASETIIFAHPYPLNHTAWIYQVPIFAEDDHVYTFDQRCFGLSDKPEYSFNVDEYGRDLQRFINNAGITKTYLVGLSLGGSLRNSWLF